MSTITIQDLDLSKTIGFIKYKVDKLHKKYQRTQTKVDHYEQLTVVIG